MPKIQSITTQIDTPEFEEKVNVADLDIALAPIAIEPFEINNPISTVNISNMEAKILKLFQKLTKGNAENQSFESPKTLLRIKKFVEKFIIMDNEKLVEKLLEVSTYRLECKCAKRIDANANHFYTLPD